MPGLVTDALVLRRADWRDYDRMVTLLTPNGRVDAVARGCRRPKSALLAAAEPFTAGEYTLYLSGGRYSIDQFRATDTFYALREDYERLTHGAYWLRLLEMQAVPNQPSEELFRLSLRALAHLCYTKLHPVILTMAFELHFLSILGLAPQMDACVRCGKPVEGNAWFDAQGGGVVCVSCRRTLPDISNGARRILLRVPPTKFEAVDKLAGRPDVCEAAKFTRAFLSHRMELDPGKTPDLADILPDEPE